MLKRLEFKETWRTLGPETWPKSAPAGKKTIIYGHNGSGKSTIANALLNLAEGNVETPLTWVTKTKKINLSKACNGVEVINIQVFTRAWVESNLRQFLAGNTGKGIVTLGHKAIEAQERIIELEKGRDRLREKIEMLEKEKRQKEERKEQICKDVQKTVITLISAYDKAFNANKFNKTKVRELIESQSCIDESVYNNALKSLQSEKPEPIQRPRLIVPTINLTPQQLQKVLMEVPSSLILEKLKNEPKIQSWIEEGLSLHDGKNKCLFCENSLSKQRIETLKHHFDDSWEVIRQNARDLLLKITDHKKELQILADNLPHEKDFPKNDRENYANVKNIALQDINQHISYCDKLIDVLNQKIEDPNQQPHFDIQLPLELMHIDEVMKAVANHNENVTKFDNKQESFKDAIKRYNAQIVSGEYMKLTGDCNEIGTKILAEYENLEQVLDELNKIKESQYTTSAAAENITKDLEAIFGKRHLRVVPVEDGKSYQCLRGNAPAENLSEGEQMTIALLYFLHNVSALGDRNKSLKESVVVVDDPSSSLDRECVYNIHRLLSEKLEKFGQIIVLTHDFALLRLFSKSLANQMKVQQRKINSGEVSPEDDRKVSFLRLHTSIVGDGRKSVLNAMSDNEILGLSEYNLIFKEVISGVCGLDESTQALLLPNAARRLLEIFLTMRYPDVPQFLNQIKCALSDLEKEGRGRRGARDCYDFMNRYSHGEGDELIRSFDYESITRGIRSCIEFMYDVDPTHFRRMCAVADISSDMVSRFLEID